MSNSDERRFVTPKQASVTFGFAVGYLANLRAKKQRPMYHKAGKKILYRVSDFEAWVTACPVKTIDQMTA